MGQCQGDFKRKREATCGSGVVCSLCGIVVARYGAFSCFGLFAVLMLCLVDPVLILCFVVA